MADSDMIDSSVADFLEGDSMLPEDYAEGVAAAINASHSTKSTRRAPSFRVISSKRTRRPSLTYESAQSATSIPSLPAGTSSPPPVPLSTSSSSATPHIETASGHMATTDMDLFAKDQDVAGWKKRWEDSIKETKELKRALDAKNALLQEANIELAEKRRTEQDAIASADAAAEAAAAAKANAVAGMMGLFQAKVQEVQDMQTEVLGYKAEQTSIVDRLVKEKIEGISAKIRERASEDCGDWAFDLTREDWSSDGMVKVEKSLQRTADERGKVLFLQWSRTGVTDHTLTALDAKVLAQVFDPLATDKRRAYLAVYSPNMSYVPRPLLGERVTRGRADGNFGLEDFKQHPQYFDHRIPYLFAIHRQPEGPKGEGFLWRRLHDSDTIVVSKAGYQGSHQLLSIAGDLLVKKGAELEKLCSELFHSLSPSDRLSQLLTVPRQLLVLAFALRESVFTVRNMRYMLAAYQRHYLESLAVYDYCKIWLPRLRLPVISNGHTLPEANTKIMGTFIKDPVMMIQFASLGIPVWRVVPSTEVPLSTTVRRLVFPTEGSAVLDQADPPYPELYRGPPGPACSVAAQDLVIGGLSYGLGTKRGLSSLHPLAQKGLSRVESVGETALGSGRTSLTAGGPGPSDRDAAENTVDTYGNSEVETAGVTEEYRAGIDTPFSPIPAESEAEVETEGVVKEYRATADTPSSSIPTKSDADQRRSMSRSSTVPPPPLVYPRLRDTWKPPAKAILQPDKKHAFLPDASPAWKEALFNIDNLESRVSTAPRAQVLKNRYVYPPAHILLGPKFLQFLKIWGIIRSRWLGELFSSTADENDESSILPPSAKQWGLEFRSFALAWFTSEFKGPKPSEIGSREARGRRERGDGPSSSSRRDQRPYKSQGPYGSGSSHMDYRSESSQPRSRREEMGNRYEPYGARSRNERVESRPHYGGEEQRLGSQQSRSSKAQERRKATLAAVVKDSFKFLTIDPVPPPSLSYGQMKVFDERTEISKEVGMLLIWEVCERNFRAEFLILDRTLMAKEWAKDPARRQGEIWQVLGTSPTFPVTPDMVSIGGPTLEGYHDLTDEEHLLRDQRRRQLFAFRSIVSSWPKAEKYPGVMKEADPNGRHLFKKMQRDCFEFYCQAFFDAFGRAPTVPRYLPDYWSDFA